MQITAPTTKEHAMFDIVKFESKLVGGQFVALPNVILATGFKTRQDAEQNLRYYDRHIERNPNAGLCAAPSKVTS